jgi:hypothetical protein
VLIYGIAESLEPNSAGSNHDHGFVTQCFKNFNGLNLSTLKVRRLGKAINANKPRPIIASLASNLDVLKILKHKNLLPQGVSVSADKTPMQRSHLKNLWKEVDEYNNINPGNPKTVKYFNGTPKIVLKDLRQQSQQNVNLSNNSFLEQHTQSQLS